MPLASHGGRSERPATGEDASFGFQTSSAVSWLFHLGSPSPSFPSANQDGQSVLLCGVEGGHAEIKGYRTPGGHSGGADLLSAGVSGLALESPRPQLWPTPQHAWA